MKTDQGSSAPHVVVDDVYRTSAIKRIRRTNAELSDLDNALVEIVAAQQPMTVR
jgi:t-SNARE complex subunit (syntaxin)